MCHGGLVVHENILMEKYQTLITRLNGVISVSIEDGNLRIVNFSKNDSIFVSTLQKELKNLWWTLLLWHLPLPYSCFKKTSFEFSINHDQAKRNFELLSPSRLFAQKCKFTHSIRKP